MATGERTARASCELHPRSPSVARCDVCGRDLCLTCAVPVRGRVIGPECLPQVLGPEDLGELPSRPRPRRTLLWLSSAAFVVALVSTLLPWTRFGTGSGSFGAWSASFRWSLIAVGGAGGGTLLAIVLVLRGRPVGRFSAAALAGLAVVVAAGAVLHALRPPSFTHASLGPWVALVAAAAGLAAAAWMLRRATHPAGSTPPS
jgi:hypothetical protein